MIRRVLLAALLFVCVRLDAQAVFDAQSSTSPIPPIRFSSAST